MKSSIIVCSTSTGYLDCSLSDIDELCKSKGYRLSPEGYCRYHYVIRRNGNIHIGRSEELKGWHHNKHDLNALLIALVGNSDNYTGSQLDSLRLLLDSLEKEYPEAKVRNASEVSIDESGVDL